MTILSSERKRMMHQQMWPPLTMIWLTEPEYEIITVPKFKDIVTICSVAHLEYIPGIWDCDNYALQFHAKVQKYQYDEFKKGNASKVSWAIGECMGTKFIGQIMKHDINIALTDDGFYFVDPQTDEIWKGHEEGDAPFFVKY